MLECFKFEVIDFLFFSSLLFLCFCDCAQVRLCTGEAATAITKCSLKAEGKEVLLVSTVTGLYAFVPASYKEEVSFLLPAMERVKTHKKETKLNDSLVPFASIMKF
jgi:hypothetical protein